MTTPIATPVSWRVEGADNISPGPSSPIRIDAVKQRDETYVYAIRWGERTCLNKNGDWEYEPLPASRATAYLKRCRYETLGTAMSHIRQCVSAKHALGRRPV